MPRIYLKILQRPEIHKQTAGLYVVVGFWESKASHDAGDPPAHTNDFVMSGLRASGEKVKTRVSDGFYQGEDNQWYDPGNLPDPPPTFKKEATTRDIVAEALGNVQRYAARWWAKRQQLPVNYQLPSVEIRGDDPHGLKTAPVRGLDGFGLEVDV